MPTLKVFAVLDAEPINFLHFNCFYGIPDAKTPANGKFDSKLLAIQQRLDFAILVHLMSYLLRISQYCAKTAALRRQWSVSLATTGKSLHCNDQQTRYFNRTSFICTLNIDILAEECPPASCIGCKIGPKCNL